VYLSLHPISRFYRTICLTLLTVCFSTCKKGEIEPDISPGTVENRAFNNTVLIDDHDYDGTVIRNCVFEDIDGDVRQPGGLEVGADEL